MGLAKRVVQGEELALRIVHQFENRAITPKALPNFSPWLERKRQPWDRILENA